MVKPDYGPPVSTSFTYSFRSLEYALNPTWLTRCCQTCVCQQWFNVIFFVLLVWWIFMRVLCKDISSYTLAVKLLTANVWTQILIQYLLHCRLVVKISKLWNCHLAFSTNLVLDFPLMLSTCWLPSNPKPFPVGLAQVIVEARLSTIWCINP